MPASLPGGDTRKRAADEPLSIAHDHESREMERYRGLALSFLPTRPHVSRLMAALGIECEQRLVALEALADELQLRHCLPAAPYHRRGPGKENRLHLFITDDAMACQTLGYALAFAQHSRQFSELMARYHHLSTLDALLVHFIASKRGECLLLEEIRDEAHRAAALT
ncbi:hypothetical protein [Halomonas aquatica]|uniref:Uncharacterized protein n=1 Tax=Halomonas aquatica TaxID=3151123 RepID=A0ABV1NAY2_9GAMM